MPHYCKYTPPARTIAATGMPRIRFLIALGCAAAGACGSGVVGDQGSQCAHLAQSYASQCLSLCPAYDPTILAPNILLSLSAPTASPTSQVSTDSTTQQPQPAKMSNEQTYADPLAHRFTGHMLTCVQLHRYQAGRCPGTAPRSSYSALSSSLTLLPPLQLHPVSKAC